jgi:hypothetical protein
MGISRLHGRHNALAAQTPTAGQPVLSANNFCTFWFENGLTIQLFAAAADGLNRCVNNEGQSRPAGHHEKSLQHPCCWPLHFKVRLEQSPCMPLHLRLALPNAKSSLPPTGTRITEVGLLLQQCWAFAPFSPDTGVG